MGLAELTSLDLKLDSFLAENVAIGKNTRSTAATSQRNLRDILRNRAANDPTFPNLLTSADCDYLGGSFARHTKIWPLDDIDLFCPLEGGTLRYVSGGTTLPYIIASDNRVSQLTLNKWQTNGYVDSAKVLEGFKTVLKQAYPATDIGVDKHCVNVQFTMAATSESDGIGFDVVPCLLLKPWDSSENFYLVPDGSGGWMRSNPRKDNILSEELQAFHLGTYRKAVRLVKQWNKYELNNAFQSYYIELVASKRFASLMAAKTVISSTSDAFQIAFSALQVAHRDGAVRSLVAGANDVQAPVLTDVQLSNLSSDSSRATLAYSKAFIHSDLSAAYAALNTIFSSSFFS